MNIITCMSLIPVILLNNYHCHTGFHLCTVAQFCIQTMRDKSVETLISVKWPRFPLCVPHPFPPKPMLYFRPVRWLDWIFLGGYLPSLSINYVAMSKDMEKRFPQLYYIKMQISYDVGFIAIGVAMAT